MTRTRQLFLQQRRQGQTDRSHVLALMYQAGALGLGPGKALTLVMRFLDTNHVEVPSLQAEFWSFWEMVGVQVKKTGTQTRAAIKAAYARSLQREQSPEMGRRGYGPRTLQAWKLSQQGLTVRQIAEDLGSTEDCVGRLILRARKYQKRKDFLAAVEALPIVAPPDDQPEALDAESEAATPPEPVLDEIGLAVTQARRRRGHRMKSSSAAFVAEGIREYCAALKIAPDLDIIAAAAEACRSNGKEAVLNAVKNTFACIKAQSMPLIQDISEVYRTITLRHWGCHFSTRRAVQLSVETLRLVYLETAGDLEAIPRAVLVDAVRRSIWPNLVLERIREWKLESRSRNGRRQLCGGRVRYERRGVMDGRLGVLLSEARRQPIAGRHIHLPAAEPPGTWHPYRRCILARPGSGSPQAQKAKPSASTSLVSTPAFGGATSGRAHRGRI
jgi:hypothetical protein